MGSADEPSLSDTEWAKLQHQPSALACCSRRHYVLLLVVGALLTASISLATVLDPLYVHLSLRSHSLLWSAPAAVILPIDALLAVRYAEQRSVQPRQTSDRHNLSASLASLYDSSHLAPLPDLRSFSVPAIHSLTRCLDGSLGSSSSPPSLRRLAVVSSADSQPSAVSLSLALRSSRWCVLVLGSAEPATFSARTAAALDTFHRLSLPASLQLPQTIEQQAERLTERLMYVSVDELSRLPYALSLNHPARSDWTLLQAESVAYTLAAHAGVDVLYDTDDAAPVVASSDLPALYMSHAFSTPPIHQRTVLHHALSLPSHRVTRRTSAHSTVRPSSAEPSSPSASSSSSSMYAVTIELVNPFPSFDYLYLWPRGFPVSQAERSLGRRVERPSAAASSYQRWQHCLPAIQQLVPNQQSALDIDHYGEWLSLRMQQQQQQQRQSATFRAARQRDVRLGLPFRAYSPVNGQSSVWLSAALSSLLLPVTVHPRVSRHMALLHR